MSKSLLNTARFLFFLLASLLIVSAGDAREWTSNDGKKIEAKFIRFESDDKITLEYQGNEIKFDIDRFGTADKKYLDELREILLANQPKEPQPKSTEPDADGNDSDGPETDKPAAKPDGASTSVSLKARRIWRDRYGIGMTARFVRMSQGTILFSVAGGFRSVSYRQLCVADREFVLEKYKAMGKEALVPFVREGYADVEDGGCGYGYSCCYDSYCCGPNGCGPNSGSQNSGPDSSFDNVPSQEKKNPADGSKNPPGTLAPGSGGTSLPPKVKLDIAPITENVLPATGFGATAPKSETVLPPNGFGAAPGESTETEGDMLSGPGLQLPPFDIEGNNPTLSSDTPIDSGSSEEISDIARNDSPSDLASSTNGYVPKYSPKSKIDFRDRFSQTPTEETKTEESASVDSLPVDELPTYEPSSNLFRDDMNDVSIQLIVLLLGVGVHLVGLVWLIVAAYSVNGVWGSTFLGLFLVRLPFADSIVGMALSLVMFIGIVAFAIRNYEIAATPLYLYLASTLVIILTSFTM